MTLLHPIFLWSLLLLAIPIAVHLFSKKTPRRIKVGSVRLLLQTESRSVRRVVKFHDPLLFVLRALIVSWLALLVATPEIACNDKASEKSWILIEPTLALEEQPAEFHQTIDSLVKVGYEIRWLESNFPTHSHATEETHMLDLWSLLAQADKQKRDTLPFFVASTRRETSLQGKRPTLSRQIRWIEAQAEETMWIERLAQLSDDSLFVVVGISSPTETRFQHLIVPVPDSAILFPPIELVPEGDSIGVALIASSKPQEKKWFSQTRTEQWCIVYDEQFANVLPYLERAVKAIACFAPVKISVEVKKQTDWEHEGENQLIWLSKSAPPKYAKCVQASNFSVESFLDETAIDALSEALLPEEISHSDVRKVSSEIVTPIVRRQQSRDDTHQQSLVFPIWLLVTVLVGIERWIAYLKE